MNGICTLSAIPVRRLPDDHAEVVSQMLFGEAYTIVQEQGDWLYISDYRQEIKGWISKLQHTACSLEEFESAANATAFVLECCAEISDDQGLSFIVPMGAVLPGFEPPFACINQSQWFYKGEFIDFSMKPHIPADRIVSIAQRFLGVPECCGGRTHFGIDASAFIQLVFRLAGFTLPGSIAMQAESGQSIEFGASHPADIAFFTDDRGILTHAGIIAEEDTLIHVWGAVRTDHFTTEGIWHEKENSISHHLHSIRRLVPK